MIVKPLLTCLFLGYSLGSALAGVVINEILYHAPNDLDDLEYVELFNDSEKPVDLVGWKIAGIGYEFPEASKIEAGGFLTLARSKALLREFYQVEAFGEFEKTLKNGGEKLSLKNAQGELVESVEYTDAAPWPISADGYSASLERICPAHPAKDPANWAPSVLSDNYDSTPSGSPGKANSVHAAKLPPVVEQVTYSPRKAKPGESISVRADLRKETPGELELLYRVAKPGEEGAEISLPMQQDKSGIFAATIPGQESGCIVRFRVKATSRDGATRFSPPENELRPAYSVLVQGAVEIGQIPGAMIINVGKEEFTKGEAYRKNHGQRRGFGPGGPPRMTEEELQRRQVSDQLNPAALQKAWADLTLPEGFDDAKREPLSRAFAVASEGMTELRKALDETKDIRSFSGNLGQKVEELRSKLTETTKPHLNEDQGKILASIQAPQEQDRGGFGRGGGRDFGRRMDPSAMLRRVHNVEESWFHVALLSYLSAEQWAGLLSLHRQARKDRDALGQGEIDFGEMFPIAMEQGEKLRESTAKILSEAQKAILEAKRGANADPFMGGPFGGPRGFGGSAPSAPLRPQGRSAFVFVDPQTGEPELFDFVNITERKSGLKVRLHKDRTLSGMNAINVLYEGNERAILNEALAYELYRQAGNAAPLAGYVRLYVNGQLAGYHLTFEQPNGSFLRRNGIDDGGNMYKLIWMGNHRPSGRTPADKLTKRQDIVGRHEKKTHIHDGYVDVVELIEELEKTKDKDALWAAIQERLDVDQVATYFAVNALLSHWDGYFNNFFLYHDTKKTGKWTMYPWDQDNTWGSTNGMGSDGLVEMALSFGAEGDVPPGEDPEEWRTRQQRPREGRGRGFGGFGGRRGGAGWWRQGGDISRPLLAHPQFHKLYLAKIKKLAETVFTEEAFGPRIEALRKQLEPEVRLRAESQGRDPEERAQDFHDILDGFQKHLAARRAWLLGQSAIKEMADPSR